MYEKEFRCRVSVLTKDELELLIKLKGIEGQSSKVLRRLLQSEQRKNK